MTQDEIIEMARDTANHGTHANGEVIYTFYLEQLEAFAKLVAQEVRDRIMFGSRDDWVLAEREACAKVVDARLEKWEKNIGKDKMYKWMRGLPEVIRARGEA